jgi:hypothetical protein
MRYALTDDEWTAIKPMLPNKPRGVPRVNDRRVLNGIFSQRRLRDARPLAASSMDRILLVWGRPEHGMIPAAFPHLRGLCVEIARGGSGSLTEKTGVRVPRERQRFQ